MDLSSLPYHELLKNFKDLFEPYEWILSWIGWFVLTMIFFYSKTVPAIRSYNKKSAKKRIKLISKWSSKMNMIRNDPYRVLHYFGSRAIMLVLLSPFLVYFTTNLSDSMKYDNKYFIVIHFIFGFLFAWLVGGFSGVMIRNMRALAYHDDFVIDLSRRILTRAKFSNDEIEIILEENGIIPKTGVATSSPTPHVLTSRDEKA